MNIRSISDFRKAMRHGPYAWQGGYPCYFVTSDGAALSFESVRSNLRSVLWSIANDVSDGWQVVAMDINWEDTELTCDHSGKPIESAYGSDQE